MPKRHFPDWITAYLDFTRLSEAPLDFHFWTGVSTIAAVLKRRVWIDQLHFKWTPNFYIIFVGPAGVVTKSTTLDIGSRMLRQIELPGGGRLKFGPDSMTWQGLSKKFEEAMEFTRWINPATGEEEMLKMSPITCSISELGTFLRPDDKGLISFLTDAWDGKDRPFEHYTLTNKELIVENPWLNIIGATTPEWINDNFPVSMVQQGIGSRIIFVFGDRKRNLVAYPSRLQTPYDYHLKETRLIEDLQQIADLCGPYEMTEEAFQWGTSWYEQHYTGKRSVHTASPKYAGYMARKQTHIHKLAMVLAASQRDTLVLHKEDLEKAEQILTATEQSMIRVFEQVGQRDEARWVAEIFNYVKAYGWIQSEELYKLCWNIMSKQDFIDAVRTSVDGGLLEVEMREGKKGLKPKRKLH